MKRNRIAVSFVGVFKVPQIMIPQLDSNFCKNIFGIPESTIASITPTGFIIKHKVYSTPVVAITPQKIIVGAKDLEKLEKYIVALKEKLPEYDFAAYGLNQELEWLDLPMSANKWMFQRFIQPKFALNGEDQAFCGKLNLQYVISDKERLLLDFEPRNNVDNGLFLSVNHHNQYLISGFPNVDKLKELFARSEEKLSFYLGTLVN